MSASLEIKEGAFGRMGRLLKNTPKGVIDEIRKATLYIEAVVKKDFLSVSDGVSRRPNTQVKGTSRTTQPGLRVSTGFLRNNVRSDFRNQGRDFEGAVGTNVHYGVIHETRKKYAFLMPGLQKALPEIRKRLSKRIEMEFGKP